MSAEATKCEHSMPPEAGRGLRSSKPLAVLPAHVTPCLPGDRMRRRFSVAALTHHSGPAGRPVVPDDVSPALQHHSMPAESRAWTRTRLSPCPCCPSAAHARRESGVDPKTPLPRAGDHVAPAGGPAAAVTRLVPDRISRASRWPGQASGAMPTRRHPGNYFLFLREQETRRHLLCPTNEPMGRIIPWELGAWRRGGDPQSVRPHHPARARFPVLRQCFRDWWQASSPTSRRSGLLLSKRGVRRPPRRASRGPGLDEPFGVPAVPQGVGAAERE